MALLYTYAFAGLTDRFATGAFSLADWEELGTVLAWARNPRDNQKAGGEKVSE
jgi:hypothetical protein